jgi:hypothetical protein
MDAKQETPQRGRWKRWWIWLLAILGFLIVGALLTEVLVKRQRASHQRTLAEIQKRLAAIRATGQPLTAEDLAKLYPDPPPEKDAILLLRPALDMLDIPEDTTNLPFFALDPPRSAPLDPSVVAEGRKWLDRNQEAFDLIPWSKLKGAWVGCGYTNGFLSLTEVPARKMNSLVRLLALKAVLEAELEHPREVVESLQRASMIGNTLKNDLQLHFLIRANKQALISRTVQRVVNRLSLGDGDLASLTKCLTLTDIGATRETRLINERPDVLFLTGLSKPGTNQLTSQFGSSGQRQMWNFQSAFLYHDDDLLHYLDWSDRCLATLDWPVSNAIPALRKMDALEDEAAKGENILAKVLTHGGVSFLSIAEPHFASAFLAELKAVAQVRVAVTALAVERWRSAHGGQLPSSLAELAPGLLAAVPADPFDGQPLRYKKLAKGYVIYSIGEDFTDDGGKEQDPDAAGADEHYDITFTVDK